MKEVRRAPLIDEFPCGINSVTVLCFQEDRVARIVSHQGFGDFGVIADWVFTEASPIKTDGGAHVFENGFGGQSC